ncbi:MAG: polyphosphate polymerase domain-containing protein [Phycisphaerae bacterium]|nr:polyphosphate polymerase domain-containing protein [Phycisphaerae bacterium]
MIRSRYELKYRITEAQAVMIAEHIRPYMRPDRHSATGEYSLVSLYLDSADLRLYRETRCQVKNRYKLRIRSYSSDPDAPCFFEIKRRINRVGVKSRARVPREAVVPLLADAIRPCRVSCREPDVLEQFLYYRQLLHAAPVVELRYLREAFESRFDDDVRVTFDRHLRCRVTHAPELGHNGCGWHQPPERGVVLEIKFTHGYPLWISRMLHAFGLRLASNSKYMRAIRHEMRFGGRAGLGGFHETLAPPS